MMGRDVLMRFIKAEPESLSPELNNIFDFILKSLLDFYPRVSAREGLELRIPMAHRYTKFNYVVDPFTIYIPYHYSLSELYGIYLREKEINHDAKAFVEFSYRLLSDEKFYERLRITDIDRNSIQSIMRHSSLFIAMILSIYFEALYLHALAHHIVEDIATIYEISNIDKYSPIKDAKNEEAFCETIMYKALRGEPGWNEPQGGYALKIIYNLRDILVIPPVSPEDLMRFLKSFRAVLAPIYYIYRFKIIYNKYDFLKPHVTEDIAQLSLVFKPIWYQHIHDVEPFRTGSKTEIFGRIYSIQV